MKAAPLPTKLGTVVTSEKVSNVIQNFMFAVAITKPMEYDPQQEMCIVQGYGSICADETLQNQFACEDELQCSHFVGNVFQSIPACYCEEPFYLPYVTASSGNKPTCLPARIGLSCSNSFPCHESKGLICLEGKCRCPHPASQIFTSEGCVGIPEFPNGCNLEENRKKHCFKGSSCGEDKTCHCNPGSTLQIGSYPRYCRLDHGQPCIGEEDCNTSRGLKCINEVCSCERDSNIQYDVERRICTLSEGVPCDSKPVWSSLPCSAGLECRQTDDHFLEKCMEEYNNDDEDGDYWK